MTPFCYCVGKLISFLLFRLTLFCYCWLTPFCYCVGWLISVVWVDSCYCVDWFHSVTVWVNLFLLLCGLTHFCYCPQVARSAWCRQRWRTPTTSSGSSASPVPGPHSPSTAMTWTGNTTLLFVSSRLQGDHAWSSRKYGVLKSLSSNLRQILWQSHCSDWCLISKLRLSVFSRTLKWN